MEELSKKMKKEIRLLCSMAYEEELKRALLGLAKKVDLWKSGVLTSAKLTEEIHMFHDGESREIFKRYAHPMEKMCAAWAIANGILQRDVISPEVMEALKAEIAFYEEKK